MRSTLALLLLFGAVIGDPLPTCTLYELPLTGSCERIIKWKVHDDDQALATCLDYFPTTFVKGKVEGNTVKCTVKAAYECLEDGTFLMFDKCYKFPETSPGSGKYKTGKMSEYAKFDGTGICEKGKLSVFYSSDHAKFVGMKAHKLGIDKLWIGITADGKTIEEPKMKIHSKLWNLVEDDYWLNGKLTKGKAPDGVANYFFMRTDTDYVLGRWQGKFEQTDGNNEAAFACEYESKFQDDQEWYCEKLPMLGIAAAYSKQGNDERCLYVSASKVTFDGKFETMKQMTVCQEKPSDLHSARIDDGTGDPAAYQILAQSNKGTLRFGGRLVEKLADNPAFNSAHNLNQGRCEGVVTDSERLFKLRQKWRLIGHSGKEQNADYSGIPWDSKHPLNECSDFPDASLTIGMRNGQLIDMPPQVLARAVCSIKFFQECAVKDPCPTMQECTNVNKFQTNTYSKKPGFEEGFFTCGCPGNVRDEHGTITVKVHDEEYDGSCKWQPSNDNHCAFLDYGGNDEYLLKNNYRDIYSVFSKLHPVKGMVVRDNCRAWIIAGPTWGKHLLMEGYGAWGMPNSFTAGAKSGGHFVYSAGCDCK